MSNDDNLNFPKKSEKRATGYYLPTDVIAWVKKEAVVRGVSQNELVAAILRQHIATSKPSNNRRNKRDKT